MNILDIILEKKQLEGVSWNKLAENLPISGEALRISFNRKSVNDTYLKEICRILNIEDKANEISESTTVVNYSNVNVPYYDADFSGGWGSPEMNNQIRPSFYITSPDFEKANFACNLVGHSISRRIPSGSVIGLREIFDWEVYFPTNEIYGVVLKNDLRTVKIVKRSKENKEILILMPDPLDQYNQTIYEPEEVPVSFVVKFYQVVAWAQFERIAM